jgi:hypothetical protein
MEYTSITKVRKGVYCYRHTNGWIQIGNQRYSVKEAIKKWRSNNK